MKLTIKAEGGKHLYEHESLPYGNSEAMNVPRVGEEVVIGNDLYVVTMVRWTPSHYKIEVFVRSKT